MTYISSERPEIVWDTISKEYKGLLKVNKVPKV